MALAEHVRKVGIRPTSQIIHPFSPEAMGQSMKWIYSNAADTTWPAANLAIGYPFILPESRVATDAWIYTGTFSSGNVDVGVYDTESGSWTFTTGSTVVDGTSDIQMIPIADVPL